MASSKVISNASQPNQDPPRQQRSSTLSALLADLQTSNHTATMEDLFKDIYAPHPPPEAAGDSQRMTLEDFLTKAGAATMQEVNGLPAPGGVNQPVESTSINGAAQFPGFGNNGLADYQRLPAAGGGGGRGKRRTVEEPPMDKASQQKQKRMIKNRESAARSRERKQVSFPIRFTGTVLGIS